MASWSCNMEDNEKIKQILVDRALTSEEQTLTRWIIEHGVQDANEFLDQLDRARVCELCFCGCTSINFKIGGMPNPGGGLGILGDFIFGENDTRCGIFVFEQGGVLAGLEVYGLAGDAPDFLPNKSDLRNFYGSEL